EPEAWQVRKYSTLLFTLPNVARVLSRFNRSDGTHGSRDSSQTKKALRMRNEEKLNPDNVKGRRSRTLREQPKQFARGPLACEPSIRLHLSSFANQPLVNRFSRPPLLHDLETAP